MITTLRPKHEQKTVETVEIGSYSQVSFRIYNPPARKRFPRFTPSTEFACLSILGQLADADSEVATKLPVIESVENN